MTVPPIEIEELRPRICVIGVGGAGGNAVANMMRSHVGGVEFMAINTDAQALRHSPADQVLQLGRTTTEGLGAGSRAEIGKAAAEESLAAIDRLLEGAHMCFIAAGMGGGTGSGAAPVIAKAARDKGILTVGVVTKPFAFEGQRRARTAEAGLAALRQHVDTLIVIPNQNLFRIADPALTFKAAFVLADEVLQKGVRGITDLMTTPGLINLDFADIRTIMANTGSAMLGVGEASGEGRALRAAEQAVSNPLLDEAMKGAKGLIISITGGDDIGLWEIDEIASHVGNLADLDADIIWGSAFDPSLAGTIRVSVVATGIDSSIAAPKVSVPVLELAGRAAASATARQDAFQFPAEPRASVSPAMAPSLPEAAPPALAVVRKLQLTPPPGSVRFATIDPFAVPADQAPALPAARGAPTQGASLFERMALLARGLTDDAGDSYDARASASREQYRRIGPRQIDQAA